MNTTKLVEDFKKKVHPALGYSLISLSVMTGLFFVLFNVDSGVGPVFLQNASQELVAAVISAEFPVKFGIGDTVSVSNPSGVTLLRYGIVSGTVVLPLLDPQPPVPTINASSTREKPVPVVLSEAAGTVGKINNDPRRYANDWYWHVQFTPSDPTAPAWKNAGWVPQSSLTLVTAGSHHPGTTPTPTPTPNPNPTPNPTPTPTPTPNPTSTPTPSSTGGGVSVSRLKLLSRGINGDNTLNNFRLAPYAADDIAKIKSMGFTYARVDVDPNWLVTGVPVDSATGGPAGLSDAARVAAGLARMDSLVANFSQAGLAVVVSVHPQYVLRALPPAQVEDAVLKAQDVITKRYANQYTPDQIFFEVQNEPHFDNATWNSMVPTIVAEMRHNAPNHTIIVPPAWYDLATNFKDLTPINDPNIVYVMHVYYPGNLTQQGAGGGAPDPNYIFPKPTGSTNKSEVTEAQLDEYIKVGVDWANAHNVPLIIGEFGASNLVGDAQSRINWIKFVKADAEKYNIGWAWWGWDGRLFGVRPHNRQGAYDQDLVNILSS